MNPSHPATTPTAVPSTIPALVPRDGTGHQFLCYADSCSGIPGTLEEAAFARVNAVVSRLRPAPQFICFPGDEIIGLNLEPDALRKQWRHWLDHELGWLDRETVPLYHTTGNHTTYDRESEAVFAEILNHLPRNGPSGQEGLTYYVRRDDLLLVFVHTLWSGLGGEGCLEHTWLERTLADHADARYKLVFGHHPVHPVNGRYGPHELTVLPEHGEQFWQRLVEHRVLAYICSHLLTFDVQVHGGVLQILTAGAGRAHSRLHCVQAAVDSRGLRYQVIDADGQVSSWLEWPPRLPPSSSWEPFTSGDRLALACPMGSDPPADRLVVWRFSGTCDPAGEGDSQTLLSGGGDEPVPAPCWIGLLGPERRLGALLRPGPGRSPSYWLGSPLATGKAFDFQLAFQPGMGPGGVLWRGDDLSPWSTLASASPWGPDSFTWPTRWCVGHDQRGPGDRPFRGRELQVRWHVATCHLDTLRGD